MSTPHEIPREREADTEPPQSSASEKPERPSVLQTIAGALTAITVTYLMSFLGVAGTIIGVGLVSVLTVLGNYMYSSAIHSAKEKVAHAKPKARAGSGPRTASGPARSAVPGEPVASSAALPDEVEEFSAVSAADAVPTQPQDTPERAALESLGHQPQKKGLRGAWHAMRARYGTGKILASIALVFVLIGGAVTAVELAAGKPLSDVVRNQESQGTSFFGGSGSQDSDDDSDTDTDQTEETGNFPGTEDDADTDQTDQEDGSVDDSEESGTDDSQQEDSGQEQAPEQLEENTVPDDGAEG